LHLFVDISSHGFGHLAITGPVLNALAEIVPDLQLTIRTRLPTGKLQQRIHLPFKQITGSSDFGFEMIDATHINYQASSQAYREAHINWDDRVKQEATFLEQLQPDMVLSNVSYLPLAGAKLAGIPAISICSLNWADLFLHFFGHHVWANEIHQQMLDAYRSAQTFIRITPGMPMPQLSQTATVGPIAKLGKKHDIGLGADKAILVALGGVSHHLPIDCWPRLPGIRWLVARDWQITHPDAINFESFGLNFTDLLCSVDAIVTKPGYGTFTEAACNGTPVIYQRRNNWPEQDCLIKWLHQHVAALEIPEQSLLEGELGSSLERLWQQAKPPAPVPSGAESAAKIIKKLLALHF
jgi:hypothetical protein